MKAFVLDPLWDDLITPELNRKLVDAGIEIVLNKKPQLLKTVPGLFDGSEERILCINPDYVGWKLSENDYKNIPNLKAILGAATAFSWVDMSYATKHNIPVCNIKNFATEAVAEWAILMMFNVARQTPRLIKDNFPLDFDKDFMKYRGIELHGKTAGIIGMGHIGNEIANRCAGLGMKVVYWSRVKKPNNYDYVQLTELMTNADVIFPTMALNDESKGLLTPKLLSSMKQSTIFISIVHDLFDKQVILEMVKTGKLFGFGFEAEPGSFNKYDGNVWAAPAYAWVTSSTMHNSMVKWVENMILATRGQFPNKVS